MHLLAYLAIWVDDRRYVIYRTVFTVQIAFVGYNDCTENWALVPEKNALYPKTCKI